jgi:hypothetical protein
MNMQSGLCNGICEIARVLPESDENLWLDGDDGQEDELDDVAKGKLQPSTPKGDEVPGDVVIRPNRDVALIEEDEEDDGSVPVN